MTNALSNETSRRLQPWKVDDSLREGHSLESLLNRALALLILLAIAPVLLLIAALIAWQDGAPVTFGHYRVGRNGQLFKCLKFRSMVKDSAARLEHLLATDPAAREEWARDHKLTHDPRITALGEFLRKTSLDELPQLFNVLRGDMNLVGPRPITVPELARYGAIRLHYLSVQPGLTGLWQVSGRNNLTYDERVDLDRQYVDNKSMWLDVKIFLKTFQVVLLRHGAR